MINIPNIDIELSTKHNITFELYKHFNLSTNSFFEPIDEAPRDLVNVISNALKYKQINKTEVDLMARNSIYWSSKFPVKFNSRLISEMSKSKIYHPLTCFEFIEIGFSIRMNSASELDRVITKIKNLIEFEQDNIYKFEQDWREEDLFHLTIRIEINEIDFSEAMELADNYKNKIARNWMVDPVENYPEHEMGLEVLQEVNGQLLVDWGAFSKEIYIQQIESIWIWIGNYTQEYL